MTRDLSFSVDYSIQLFEGLYGGFWGIIAGPAGIRLSKLNNLSRTQCLWKVYITFIFFTMLGSIVGFALNIAVIVIETSDYYYRAGSVYTALSSVQFILLIGKDSYLNFLIKRNFSSCDCFVLGFMELRLFKMPKSIIRANSSRKCNRCSKEQWHHLYRRPCKE